MNKREGQFPPAQAFVPQTLINSTPGGIQIIAPVAPQVSLLVELSLEQLTAAMQHCLQLRAQQGQVDKDAVAAMMSRKDLHRV